MQLSNIPVKLPLPFAAAGSKNSIPEASQIGITNGAASLTDGFPPLTRTPIVSGGVPPSGLDMNGILFELSAVVRWANAGGGYPYDATFATDANVNGYPKGARVMRSDGLGYWFNTAENNTVDPESVGAIAAGWLPDFTTGASAVTMTNANVTLTALQYGKPIIVITGALVGNLNLIFPNIYGEWTVINSTTGAFSITCKTAAGTGVVVASIEKLVGDATNIYSSSNDAIGEMNQLISAAGGTADALTGTFSPAPTSWPNGVPFLVRAASANATTTPTFTANSGTLAAKTIVKGSNAALLATDIAGAGHWLILQYDVTLDKVVLLNPANGVSGLTQTAADARYAKLAGLSTQSFNTSTLTAAGLISSTLGNNVPIFTSLSATTGWQYMRIANTSGGLVMGVEGSAANALIIGDTAYDACMYAVSGISFSANNGTNLHMRLSNAGNLSTSGSATHGNGTAIVSTKTNGSNSGTGGGGYMGVANGGADVIFIGNKSCLLGTAYDATPMLYGASAISVNVGMNITGKVNASTAASASGDCALYQQAFGLGQTWQDMTGSRAIGSTYTNSTAAAIHAKVKFTLANTLLISTLSVGASEVAWQSGTGAGTYTYTLEAVIQPGQTYTMTSSTGTLVKWMELRT